MEQNIHFIWISKGGIQMPEEYRPHVETWRAMNSSWVTKFWEGEELNQFVLDSYPQFRDTWTALDKPVMKSDMARLLLLHHFGGIYLDADLKPFSGTREPLTALLASGKVYDKYAKGGYLPDVPSETYVDLANTPTIFSRENCQIDATGHGIANNMLMTRKGSEWIMEFMEQQKNAFKGLVLDFLGPWALTRFWRSKLEKNKECLREFTILPSAYFLWEEWRMNSPVPKYAISAHVGQNTWGDHTKKKWFMV